MTARVTKKRNREMIALNAILDHLFPLDEIARTRVLTMVDSYFKTIPKVDWNLNLKPPAVEQGEPLRYRLPDEP